VRVTTPLAKGGQGGFPVAQAPRPRTPGPHRPIFLLPLAGCLPPRAPGPRFALFDPSASGLFRPVALRPGPHRRELVARGAPHLTGPRAPVHHNAVFHRLGPGRRPGGQGQAHHHQDHHPQFIHHHHPLSPLTPGLPFI
jgi:hypothetical protein